MIKCSGMLFSLSDKITIVVSVKNDETNINNLLKDISDQYYVNGVRVVIVDKYSTDNTIDVINDKKNEYNNLNLEIIQANSLKDAKDKASESCNTPYIFFIDSNVRLPSSYTFLKSVRELQNRTVVTCDFQLYSKSIYTRIVYWLYNILYRMLVKVNPLVNNSYFCISYRNFVRFGKFNRKGYQQDVNFIFDGKLKPTDFKVLKNEVTINDSNNINSRIYDFFKTFITTATNPFNKNISI